LVVVVIVVIIIIIIRDLMCQRKKKRRSHLTAVSQSVSQSWLQAPSRALNQMLAL
jgi:flagellar biosynthesis/type III secretory pathway M-ring protein FliF/YscJ